MLTFFRRIRKGIPRPGEARKYLLYAVGEVLLVMVGILLALQVNNWNDRYNKKTQLDNIYSIVHTNLSADLINIDSTIVFYKDLNKILDEILTTQYPKSFIDSINETNFLECEPCVGHIAYYTPFYFENKGIELLRKYDEHESLGKINLIQEVIQFYTQKGNLIIKFLDFVESEAYNNLKYYEQFNWYTDYMAYKYNPDAILFFTQDQNYKNKVATFKNIAVENYLENLYEYRKGAIEIINKIERRQK